MSPTFLMLCGIMLLLILPTLLSPGGAKVQDRSNTKRIDKMLGRRKLTSEQLDWVVERCVDYRLRATDLVLVVISILNVSVLFCFIGIQNELLVRVTQVIQEGGPPPSYEEAMHGYSANHHRST